MVKNGENVTIGSVTNNRLNPRHPATRSISSLTAAWLPFTRYSDSTGTKAWLKAPSENRRRRNWGTLKATKKASAPGLSAITVAKQISRNRPSTREIMVMELTTEPARINWRAEERPEGGEGWSDTGETAYHAGVSVDH